MATNGRDPPKMANLPIPLQQFKAGEVGYLSLTISSMIGKKKKTLKIAN